MDITGWRAMWNNACLQAGLKSISTDTAARIMAVVHIHGNNEAFCFNDKFLADIDYIQKEYHVAGGEEPDVDFAFLVKKYSDELIEYYQAHKNDKIGDAVFHDPKPQWAIDLFKERYNIKLIN